MQSTMGSVVPNADDFTMLTRILSHSSKKIGWSI